MPLTGCQFLKRLSLPLLRAAETLQRFACLLKKCGVALDGRNQNRLVQCHGRLAEAKHDHAQHHDWKPELASDPNANVDGVTCFLGHLSSGVGSTSE
jgi:hypothetical protein